MPTLHDLMASSIDGRAAALGAADAAPAGATRGLIARRRRRNTAVAGGTSALAIGGLVAAVVTRERADTTPADPEATAYVEVELNREDSSFVSDGWESLLTCGQTVPDTLVSDQGFTQSVAVGPTISGDGQLITGSLSYDGPDRAPAFINRGYVVLARDGIVVADYVNDLESYSPFDPVTHGSTWNTGALLNGALFQAYPCMGDPFVYPDPDDVAYPAGDYQLFVVSRAHTNARYVALSELDGLGYSLESDASGAWNPGSVDCQNAIAPNSGLPLPVQCLDTLPLGVTIDRASGTAKLPYHLANYSGDLDVTLVSEPIAVGLDHDVTYADLGEVRREPTEPAATPPFTCGEDATLESGDLQATFAHIPSFADLLAGSEAPILVDMRTGGKENRGTLHIADGATAALVVREGWVAALATPVLTPSPVPIDRSKGYPDVSIRLDNVAECPTPTAGNWAFTNLDPNVSRWVLQIQGGFRVDWEDGTSSSADSITLSGSAEG